MDDAALGGDDEARLVRLDGVFQQRGGRADEIGHRHHRLLALRVGDHGGVGVLPLQLQDPATDPYVYPGGRYAGDFNSALMNDAIYKFKRYEDASLEYIGINKRPDEEIGLFDTVLPLTEYKIRI